MLGMFSPQIRKCIWVFSCAWCLLVTCVEAQVWNLPAVNVGGREYLRVSDLARTYGMKTSVSGRTVTLSSPSGTLQIEMDSREATLNGVKVWLSAPVTVARGMTMVGRLDAIKVINPVLSPPHSKGPTEFRAIVIDPGHGGNDNGTMSASGILEKRMALDVATRLQQVLSKQGFVVTMTRTRDTTLNLDRRVAIARELGADLFVSVHFNSEGRGRTARGIETYCLTPSGAASTASSRVYGPFLAGNRNDDCNMLLAYQVQRSLVSATSASDRGVRRARFYVLQYAQCPAILVECGFLSNPNEAGTISSGTYRDRLANGIAQGILSYKRTLER